MPTENPRSFRLSPGALDALHRLQRRTGRKAVAVIEALLLDAERETRDAAIIERLEDHETRLRALEHRHPQEDEGT